MKRVVLNTRTSNPAYLDLIVQHPVNNCAGFFRIGDRAAAYIKLLEWRRDNPDRKLIILDMPDAHNDTLSCLVAKECPAEWVFGEIADELWLVDQHNEVLPKPDAECLYTQLIWAWWYYFNERRGNLHLQPTIQPTELSLKFARDFKSKWGLTEQYATIQPLFDAPYASYRNQPPEFWYEIVNAVSKEAPVVVLGHPRNAPLMATPPRVIPAWSMGLNVMESLALIHGSTMHVGGETGTTIWSSIFGVNTYGVYPSVSYEDVWLAEPISFGGSMIRINKTMEAIPTSRDAAAWWKVVKNYNQTKVFRVLMEDNG